MELNYGKDPMKGKPGVRNSRAGVKKTSSVGAGGSIPSENIGKSAVNGKPGVRNTRKGKVVEPDVFKDKSYSKGGKDVIKSSASGNPGSRNTRKGVVSKHPMYS